MQMINILIKIMCAETTLMKISRKLHLKFCRLSAGFFLGPHSDASKIFRTSARSAAKRTTNSQICSKLIWITSLDTFIYTNSNSKCQWGSVTAFLEYFRRGLAVKIEKICLHFSSYSASVSSSITFFFVFCVRGWIQIFWYGFRPAMLSTRKLQ